MGVGVFYHDRQMNPAAANRLNALVDQYPLYSKAGDALYDAGDSYSKMGPRFRKQAGEMFSRIVRDYPLSDRVKDATRRLQEMELPVPPVNQAALERAKWEKENYKAPSMMSKSMGLLKGGPDVRHSAKSGAPTMTDPKRTLPASIPVVNNEPAPGTNGAGGTTDVSVSNATSGALDSKPDARNADGTAKTTAALAPPAAPAGPLPTNRDAELKKLRAEQAKKQAKLDKKKKKTTPAAPAAPAATAPAATTPAAATTPVSTTPASQQ
jgi:outer membrane protein assembly factor BamD